MGQQARSHGEKDPGIAQLLGIAQHVKSFNHPSRACCPATPQVAELAAVVAKVKAEYDGHDARLKERLDRLKVRGRCSDCAGSPVSLLEDSDARLGSM